MFHEIKNVIAGVSSNLAVLIEYGRNLARALNKIQQLIIIVKTEFRQSLKKRLPTSKMIRFLNT